MNPKRWQRLKEIDQAALERNPEERSRFLQESCAGDDALRRELESLLEASDPRPTFLDVPLLRCLEVNDEPDSDGSVEGRIFGHYRIECELGRGGQARVYLAEDQRLRRRVALKVLRAAPGGSQNYLRRFQREAAAISRLEHPGICTIYEAGEVEGAPFIAMRYAEGRTLAAVLLEEPEPPSQERIAWLLALFERAARALHAAHEAGIIHRDMKPNNIMVSKDGEPVLLDFGLAKDIQAEAAPATEAGDIIGTPQYMSPEQVQAPRVRLDRRTDIYSLAVAMYKCLTLREPFDGEGKVEILTSILHSRAPDPRDFNRNIGRDLSVVLAKAMEKDRERRYPTALALAEDLRRLRVREPILARPPGVALRLRRWTERNPALAGVSAALGVALIALGVMLTAFALQEARSSRALRERLARELLHSGISLCEEGEVGQGLLWMVRALKESRQEGPEVDDAIRRNIAAWEREILPLHAVLEHEGAIPIAAFSPDSSRLLTASWDGTGRVWSAECGEPVTPPLQHAGQVRAAAFSPDGNLVATGSADGTARLWSAASGNPVGSLMRHEEWVDIVVFSPDGSCLLTGGSDRTGRIWSAATGAPIGPSMVHQGIFTCLTFSRDGSTVVSGSTDGVAKLWRVDQPVVDDPSILELRIEAATGMELEEDGSIRWLDGAAVAERRDALVGEPLR